MVTSHKEKLRLPPAERRRQLLDAALELAFEDGFDALTTAGIAQRAGVTRPMIYDQFGDLDGLLLALIDREETHALATLRETIPQDPGELRAEQYLARAIDGFLSAVQQQPQTWRLLLQPPQGSPPVLRTRVAENRQQLTARITGLVEWGLSQRGITGIDHDIAARLLVAVGEDAARLVLNHPRRYPPARFATAAATMLELLLPEGSPHPPIRWLPTAVENLAIVTPSQGNAGDSHTRGRMPQAQRREQLLDVTLDLLSSEGFDALSVEAIARRAGVNRTVVYRSFANLAVLLAALLRREQQRVDRTLDTLIPADPGDRVAAELLSEALRDFLAAIQAAPQTWRLALMPPESAPQAVRSLIHRRRAALVRRILRLVRWALTQLDVPKDALDIELLSRMLLSLAEEHGRLALEDTAFPPARLEASANAILAIAPWRPTTS
jgi:AcrR family transcriptional regulator